MVSFMKSFLLIASLSFASAVMLVPHNGNETRSGVFDAILPVNNSDNGDNIVSTVHHTNDVNTKHRPHLAIVESRKLLQNNGESDDDDMEKYNEYEDSLDDSDDNMDKGHGDGDDSDDDDEDKDDSDDTDDNTHESDDSKDVSSNSRHLLRHVKVAPKAAPAPAPKAAPAPAPKAAPAPAPKAAPAPAPKAAPAPAPKAAPAPAPKAAPAPAPKAAPAPAPKAAPAPAPKAAPAPAPKAAPAPAPKAAPAPAPAPKAAPAPAPKAAPAPAPAPAPKAAPAPAPKAAPTSSSKSKSSSSSKSSSVLKPVTKISSSVKKIFSKLKTNASKAGSTVKKVVSKVKDAIPTVKSMKIYGKYCGPGYCGGEKFKGAEGPNCKWGVSPKDSLDSCCKVHDQCCGSPNTRSTSCNKEILSCIDKVKCEGSDCTIAQAAMKAAFTLAKNKVCGDILGSKKNKLVTATPSTASTKTASQTISVTTPTTSKYSSVSTKHSKRTQEIAKKLENAFTTWVVTSEGQDAVKFCQSLGISNKPDIYNGCIEDIRVTNSKSIARESALAAEEFLAKGVANPSKRYCVASGDPHVTNYDGELFHIQEPGIYTVARTPDSVFEIQEKMRKNGNNKPGVPSCMTGAVLHYKQMNIEVDVTNFGKILVNGKEMDLPEDFTLTFGGVQIRYGKQVIEWKGNKVQPAGLKLTTPNGFSVMISGGYCGVLETNVPTAFFGKMQGICGNADGTKHANDYADPKGVVMDVNHGAKQWERSGYNGPDSPLSKWQLAWKPRGSECYFAKDCESSLQTQKVTVVVSPTPSVAPAASTRVRVTSPTTVPVSPPASASTPTTLPKSSQEVKRDVKQEVKQEVKQDVKPEVKQEVKPEVKHDVKQDVKSDVKEVGKVSSGSMSSSTSSKHTAQVCEPPTFPKTSTKKIKEQVSEISANTKSKMSELYTKFKTMMDDLKVKHREQVDADKKLVTNADDKAKDIHKKYSTFLSNAEKIFEKLTVLNHTIHQHHAAIELESDYLAKLKIFKPKFLSSLENVKSQVVDIKSNIHTTIVEGDDKKSLLSLLNDVRTSTDKSAALLSKTFLDHYDKYANKLTSDRNKYEDELRKLKIISDDYKLETTKRDSSWKEYSDILQIVKKLKETYKNSDADEKSFDELMIRIAIAFKNNEESKSISDKGVKLSTPNTQCATDVLKTHIDHKHI